MSNVQGCLTPLCPFCSQFFSHFLLEWLSERSGGDMNPKLGSYAKIQPPVIITKGYWRIPKAGDKGNRREWHRYRPQTILATIIFTHVRPYQPQKCPYWPHTISAKSMSATGLKQATFYVSVTFLYTLQLIRSSLRLDLNTVFFAHG